MSDETLRQKIEAGDYILARSATDSPFFPPVRAWPPPRRVSKLRGAGAVCSFALHDIPYPHGVKR